MSLVTILGLVKRAQIGPITISCSVRETHTNEAELTDHAIETGSDVTDHRTVKPASLDMEGIISDANVDLLEESFSVQGASIAPTPDSSVSKYDPSLPNQVKLAYLKLMDLFIQQDVFTVVTALRKYDNMVFTKFNITKDKDTQKILSFQATLRQVNFVSPQNIAAADLPKAAAPVDAGKQTTTPAAPSAAAQGTSVLNDGAKSLFGGAKDIIDAVAGLFK
jgi:hypothetical protein